MIAVCLLTCGREELSSRTVISFREHNRGRADLVLLHADAGGPDTLRNRVIAINGAFKTIAAPKTRVGQIVSFRTLIKAAIGAGAEFVLWLENDWESVAPIPSVDWLRRTTVEFQVETWRLFGERKMKGDGPRALAGANRIGTDVAIGWKYARRTEWEIGRAHWGAGGCIARTDYLRTMVDRRRLKDVITARNDLISMRPIENIMFHIGDETTPGFMG